MHLYQVLSFISSKWWGKKVILITGLPQRNTGSADTVEMKK